MPSTPRPSVPASYSTVEVARRFGVSTATVQRWVDQGLMKAWKTAGGHRRIDAQSAESFFRGQGLSSAALHSALVVDDNPDDRDLLSSLVEAALPGVQVEQADNGFQALMMIGRSRPDVLVTDLVMPHMNGAEMLRQVMAQPGGTPVAMLAVTSRSGPALASLGPLPDAVQVLRKPLTPEAFERALQAALRGSSDAR